MFEIKFEFQNANEIATGVTQADYYVFRKYGAAGFVRIGSYSTYSDGSYPVLSLKQPSTRSEIEFIFDVFTP